jgi:hypothetical protein
MNKPKFFPGQNVKMAMSHPWVGDYEISAVIVRQDNVYFNGVASYIVQTPNQGIMHQVPEDRLTADEKGKLK